MLRKRILITSVLALLASAPAHARFLNITPTVGYVNSLESIKGEYDGGATQYLSGNFGGVFAGLSVYSTHFGALPLSLSGGIDIEYASGLLHDRLVRESYVFAPLRAGWAFEVVRFDFGQKFLLEPYAGPVFKYGLSSKTDDYDFYHPSGIIEARRFNVFFGGGVKAVLNSFVLDLGYDFGLIPRYEREGAGYSYRWTCSTLHVGLAYRF